MGHKFPFLVILVCLTTVLVAGCSKTVATVSAGNSISTATRLALGTLKLEGTSQAVTASQAAELLTLWEGYASLSNSDTSSQVELEALTKQIQSAMTADQIKTIEAMSLNDQSVEETLNTLGASTVSNALASTPSATSSLNLAGPSGGPGRMAPSGDSMGISEIMSGVSAQSTSVATQSPASTGAVQVNPMLLNVLIQLLETRSQTAG